MAIDFEKIKRKVEQLSGNGRMKSAFWGPKPGKDSIVRIIPWPDGNDGQPFKERSFYYNIGGGKAILAPSQFGKPDPIQTTINKLREEGTPAAMEAAKQLYSKRRYFAPMIVRGEENEGVRLWSFGKKVCETLLQIMLEDFGDITDPKTGRDLTIKCTQQPGQQYAEARPFPKASATAAGSAKEFKEWSETVPNLDDIYKLMTYDEIEKRVNDHFSSSSTSSADGTEVVPGASATPGPGSGRGRPRDVDVTDTESTSIDDAFAKLQGLVEG